MQRIMRHYCSLADSKYLPQLLALYDSLKRHSSEVFWLHVLAMDEECYEILSEIDLESDDKTCGMSIAPVSILDVDAIRSTRTWQEFCWTMASQWTEARMPISKFGIESLTYLDADMFVTSDMKAMFDEIGDRSIGIVPHRFHSRDRKRLEPNGIFNVGVLTFKNNEVGRACLSKWARQCREWCFNRHEDGRFADQAYLNYWPSDYPDEVCVMQNPGVNLGPWSIGNYSITKRGEDVFVNHDKLVCYHFHEYKNEKQLTNWRLRPEDIEFIYRPYISALASARARIAEHQHCHSIAN